MEAATGFVVKVFGLYSTIKCDNRLINCVMRGKMRKNKNSENYANPIAVGDNVKIDIDDSGGAISEILPRRNTFSRKEKGRNKKEDLIACNIDQIVIIQSFAMPKLNLRFVDRIYIRGKKEGIPVLLCINKMDLADKDSIKYIKKYYNKANIDVCMVSALTGSGMDVLRKRIMNRVSLFAGSSGVGKTSILNCLYPELSLRVSDVSESTGKGRHATTNVEMIISKDKTSIIDTPGFREFGLMDIEPALLGKYFYEFENYTELCAYRPCTHDHEPDCEIKRMVEAQKIHGDRYISYLQLLNSLKEYHESRF